MIRKILFACAVLAGMLAMSGAALAAPPAMTLSSWETTSVDGAITGGTRTVTVTNVLDESIEGLVVPLDPTPCECDIVSASADAGAIDGFSWNVGTLLPGETKTLTLGYELTSGTTTATWLPPPLAIGMLVLMVVALAVSSVALRRQDGLFHRRRAQASRQR
jgi:hypothetical protein